MLASLIADPLAPIAVLTTAAAGVAMISAHFARREARMWQSHHALAIAAKARIEAEMTVHYAREDRRMTGLRRKAELAAATNAARRDLTRKAIPNTALRPRDVVVANVIPARKAKQSDASAAVASTG